VHDSPRFDNPYCRAPFLATKLEIRQGEGRLELDFASHRRHLE
jgi:hypothetical protein